MIRCTGTKCKLHSDKNNCRHRDRWGICKLSKSEFQKYIISPNPAVKEVLPKKELKVAKEERNNG